MGQLRETLRIPDLTNSFSDVQSFGGFVPLLHFIYSFGLLCEGTRITFFFIKLLNEFGGFSTDLSFQHINTPLISGKISFVLVLSPLLAIAVISDLSPKETKRHFQPIISDFFSFFFEVARFFALLSFFQEAN